MESKVVSAVGVASSSNVGGKDLAKAIELAMSEEVLKCTEEGIAVEEKNSGQIRVRMMEARKRVVEQFYASQEEEKS